MLHNDVSVADSSVRSNCANDTPATPSSQTRGNSGMRAVRTLGLTIIKVVLEVSDRSASAASNLALWPPRLTKVHLSQQRFESGMTAQVSEEE